MNQRDIHPDIHPDIVIDIPPDPHARTTLRPSGLTFGLDLRSSTSRSAPSGLHPYRGGQQLRSEQRTLLSPLVEEEEDPELTLFETTSPADLDLRRTGDSSHARTRRPPVDPRQVTQVVAFFVTAYIDSVGSRPSDVLIVRVGSEIKKLLRGRFEPEEIAQALYEQLRDPGRFSPRGIGTFAENARLRPREAFRRGRVLTARDLLDSIGRETL